MTKVDKAMDTTELNKYVVSIHGDQVTFTDEIWGAIQSLIYQEKQALIKEILEQADEYEKWVGGGQGSGHATTVKAVSVATIKKMGEQL